MLSRRFYDITGFCHPHTTGLNDLLQTLWRMGLSESLVDGAPNHLAPGAALVLNGDSACTLSNLASMHVHEWSGIHKARIGAFFTV
jgi:hypothetical protein